MARSDCYYEYINDVMDSDNESEKQRLMREFYDRVTHSEYKLKFISKDMHFYAESYRDPKDKFAFWWDGSRWRNGLSVSDADLAEKLGVPVAFLYGLLEGAELRNQEQEEWEKSVFESRVAQERSELAGQLRRAESSRKAFERAEKRHAALAAKEYKSHPVFRSLCKQAAKQVDANRKRRRESALTKKSLSRFCETIEHHQMPQIPHKQFLVSEVVAMQPFCGVYFEWDGILCAYVGESTNVPSRLKNHQKVDANSRVSFIETEHHKRYEYFYIWLLNPYKNGGLGDK